ncbi:MAG: AI-2E family transporter [Lentimicrobiaceae bacterium]|nr:AI-2E family transporter [Lentimicrobiaceae bacterium]
MNKNTNKWFSTVSLLLVFGAIIFLGWYFAAITIYIVISLILTLLCLPIKRLLEKIRFKRFKVGNALAAVLSLTIVGGILFGLFALLFVPLTEQVREISSLDSEHFDRFSQTVGGVDDFLKEYNILDEDENLEQIITTSTLNYVRNINISSTFNSVFGMIGGLFLGIFSVLFISFFLLKDIPLFKRAVVNMASSERQPKITHILYRSKVLLSNYFVGLFVEMLIMTGLQYLILILLGVPNALLISVVGGVLVLVPYIGAIIACVLGCVLGALSAFTAGGGADAVIIIWKVFASIAVTRLLDSFFLQPYIASKSVKAHPLEVFIVVLVSGYLAGITGMMLGIPAYTVIRIVAQEFFGENNFVKTLTQSLSAKNANIVS